MTTITTQAVSAERAVPVFDGRLRAHWGPIMLGALTAVGLQFILTALGVALGMSLISNDVSAEGISIAGGVWWLVTGLISLFVGGLVLGLSIPTAPRMHTCISAAAMWAVVALFGFVVLWSGMGMGATAAATPLAVVSSQQGVLNAGAAAPAVNRYDGMAANPTENARTADRSPAVSEEEAASTLQAASWWTVIGLVAGLAATWGGAIVARKPLGA